MGKPMGIGVLLVILVFGVVAKVDFKSRILLDFAFSSSLLMQALLLGVFIVIVVSLRREGRNMNLPPCPAAFPIVGNWLQVSLQYISELGQPINPLY